MDKRYDALKVAVLIPTYNNEKTLKGVLEGVLACTKNVLVVNDGSTDSTAAILSQFEVEVVHHKGNKGKGIALRTGFKHAFALGYEYVITIDSDGQHLVENLTDFLDAIEQHPETIIMGARNMEQAGIPGKSSFGHKFSNFWFEFETGIKLPDTQTGYRAYPLRKIVKRTYFTSKYEFEIEVIVRNSWQGVPIVSIPIPVIYQKGEERVTHFRPFQDFSRVSVLNTVLVILALLYHIPKRFLLGLTWSKIKSTLFNKEESLFVKSASVGFGLFMGVVPVWGYQIILGAVLAHFMKLNKALVVLVSNISIPPMIPFILFASVKVGAWVMGVDYFEGFSFQDINLETIYHHIKQYLVGSVVLAVALGVFGFLVTYSLGFVSGLLKKKLSVK